MSPVVVVLVVVFLAGIALGLYAWRAPRPAAVAQPQPPQREATLPPPSERWTAKTDWTRQAGEEFAGLSEAARCDLIFAVVDLDDERSQQLLMHALEDPSEAVVLAAAHALARRGQSDAVQQYAQKHPGERSERIVQTLALME
jgi:HEAT repeat protein